MNIDRTYIFGQTSHRWSLQNPLSKSNQQTLFLNSMLLLFSESSSIRRLWCKQACGDAMCVVSLDWLLNCHVWSVQACTNTRSALHHAWRRSVAPNFRLPCWDGRRSGRLAVVFHCCVFFSQCFTGSPLCSAHCLFLSSQCIAYSDAAACRYMKNNTTSTSCMASLLVLLHLHLCI